MKDTAEDEGAEFDQYMLAKVVDESLALSEDLARDVCDAVLACRSDHQIVERKELTIVRIYRALASANTLIRSEMDQFREPAPSHFVISREGDQIIGKWRSDQESNEFNLVELFERTAREDGEMSGDDPASFARFITDRLIAQEIVLPNFDPPEKDGDGNLTMKYQKVTWPKLHLTDL